MTARAVGGKKMGIDKETEPTYVNFVIDDNPKYLNTLRKQAEEDGQNDEKGEKRLSITNDKHSFTMEEYYYEEGDNELIISGNLQGTEGSTYISISIPLSDTVLIDIIQGAIKKLNKLKTALETLS